MNNSPAFQFYPADYLADPNVDMMTLEQQGAYVRLLCHAWRATTVGRLLNDRSTLFALARMTPEQWDQNSEAILRAFRVDDDGYITQKRLVKEWEKQQVKRLQAHEAGVRSGEVRRERPFNDRSTNRQRPVGVPLNTSASASASASKGRGEEASIAPSIASSRMFSTPTPPPLPASQPKTTRKPDPFPAVMVPVHTEDGGNVNHPDLMAIQKYFQSSQFNTARIKKAFLTFEASKDANGNWFWGKRMVGDWRAAMESRMNDDLDRDPNQNTSRTADSILLQDIKNA